MSLFINEISIPAQSNSYSNSAYIKEVKKQSLDTGSSRSSSRATFRKFKAETTQVNSCIALPTYDSFELLKVRSLRYEYVHEEEWDCYEGDRDYTITVIELENGMIWKFRFGSPLHEGDVVLLSTLSSTSPLYQERIRYALTMKGAYYPDLDRTRYDTYGQIHDDCNAQFKEMHWSHTDIGAVSNLEEWFLALELIKL